MKVIGRCLDPLPAVMDALVGSNKNTSFAIWARLWHAPAWLRQDVMLV